MNPNKNYPLFLHLLTEESVNENPELLSSLFSIKSKKYFNAQFGIYKFQKVI